ncbi:IS1182 family transposase [Marinobacterium sp. YM272]|uniref:IS1182 family transposase n=1 Tax=Marinobacterium sp. YM272 TaxID=3421654 RepID=UPI003D8000AD
MRHLKGEPRQQSTLFPESLDDYVSADNPVRVIDAYMDSLDMLALGFTQAATKHTGRKPYDPADLLKLYTYGYLNQVRSTRRLEKECHRNVEVLWLMKRLAPDFKTLANFRQQNSKAIREACRGFIQFCREASLLDSRMIAIDGSKFRAAASMSKTYNRKQLDALQKRLNRKIDDYLHLMAKSEQSGTNDKGSIHEALSQLQKRKVRLDGLSGSLDKGASQCCETEPEAKRMRSGREGIVVGYNVQSAVDVETGLIVHHDVTTEGSDNRQLEPIATAAKSELGADTLQVLADAGYSNGEQLERCEEQGIEPAVPVNRAVNNKGNYFQKSEFTYDSEQDQFTCPAGQLLTYQTYNRKKKHRLYARTGCNACPLQGRCTSADKRWVTRHFNEDALDRSQQRVDENPGLMRLRSAVVERPFAQLKHNMGMRRFGCWGKSGAESEMGLAVMAYNLNRMINALGVQRMLQLI